MHGTLGSLYMHQTVLFKDEKNPSEDLIATLCTSAPSIWQNTIRLPGCLALIFSHSLPMAMPYWLLAVVTLIICSRTMLGLKDYVDE